MFTTIAPEKIQSYLQSLLHSSVPIEEKNVKIQSIQKFIDWAITKGYINTEQFDHLNTEIAKFKNNIASSDYSKALNESFFSRLLHILPIELSNEARSKNNIYALLSVFLLITILISSFLVKSSNKGVALVQAAPSTANTLLFKGKITDSLGNVVDSKTDVTFKIYSSPISSSPLYTGACTGMGGVSPEVDGTITVKVGQDCGMKPLESSLFSAHQTLFLGVTVGSDPEMQPRKQLANVNFSSNTNALQGLPAGNSTSSIPYINEDGDLLIDAPQTSITSVSKSANFSINSAHVLTLRAQNDVNITSLTDGAIRFRTNAKKEVDNLVISTNGNIGINGADTSLFNVQVSGDIGPNYSNLYNLGSSVNQWGSIYGQNLYQNGYQVCDISGNCSGITAWSSLSTPKDNLSLSMGNYTSTLTFGKDTSTKNLFNIADTAYNTGTGYLMNVATAPGSALNPFRVSGSGSETFVILASGNVGVGLSNPEAKLRTKESGSKTAASYGGFFENIADNTTTDGIKKYGVYISSTGTFTGKTGDATTNYGIYIDKTEGADQNYDIYAESGANLSTGGQWSNASSRDLKENFTELNPEEILSKINQLNITQWNYKAEKSSTKHIGPIAEDFYSLFQVGNSNKSISTIDPAGIALIGIQALNNKIALLGDKKLTDVTSEGDLSITAENTPFTYNGIINPEDMNAGTFTLLDKGKIVDTLQAVGKLIAGTVKTGYLEAENVIIKNTAFVKDLSVSRLSSTEKITSPLVEAKKVVTEKIAPTQDNVTIDLNTPAVQAAPLQDKGSMAKVIINGLDNRAVTTIDAAGNIVTNGNITSETATISGSLRAQSIQTENFQSTNVSANTASFSGELIADNIRSKALDQINDKITTNNSSLSSISSEVSNVQRLLAELKNSSPNGNLPKDSGLNNLNLSQLNLPDNTTAENFTVNGLASLYKASVSDSLFVGNLVVRSSGLLSLNADLNISSLGTVNFFENAVMIAKDGSITATGPVHALAGIDTPQLDITNSENRSVAQINNKGEAQFKSVSLEKYTPSPAATVIAAGENLIRNGQNSPAIETEAQTAGTALIPAQSTEIIVYNDSVKDNSLVYLTSTTPSEPVALTILEKESCSQRAQPCRPYFKVGVGSAVSSALTFNWLIIN